MINRAEKPTGAIQSVERALDILFATAQLGETGITELARELGLQVPTVSNLVRTLAFRHVLTNRAGRYALGPALAALAGEDTAAAHLAELAETAVTSLVKSTGESAVAFVPSGDGLELLRFRPAEYEIAVHYPVQLLRNPLGLSSGKVLVAHAAPAARRRIVARHGHTEDIASENTELHAAWESLFERIRTQGHYATDPDSDRATASVAAPVFGAAGAIIATLGVSCPRQRATPQHFDDMLEAVRRMARRMSHDLGYLPPRETPPGGTE